MSVHDDATRHVSKKGYDEDKPPIVSETPAPAQEGLHYFQIVPGSQRYYCRAEGCMCYSDGNVPFGYCDRHLAQSIGGSPITDKLGFPPVETPAPAGTEPDPRLLQKAVDDREARPWRYYKFSEADLKLWADNLAAEVTALRQQLQEAQDCGQAQVDKLAEFVHEHQSQVATLTQRLARQARTIAARQEDWTAMRDRLALLIAGVQQIEQEMREETGKQLARQREERYIWMLDVNNWADSLHALTEPTP